MRERVLYSTTIGVVFKYSKQKILLISEAPYRYPYMKETVRVTNNKEFIYRFVKQELPKAREKYQKGIDKIRDLCKSNEEKTLTIPYGIVKQVFRATSEFIPRGIFEFIYLIFLPV